MAPDSPQTDRLLPRHGASFGTEIAWNVRLERHGLLKKEEVSSRALVHDLSLEGALVEVEERHQVEVNERVAVRFRGVDGVALVRHRRKNDDGRFLYGVKFVPNHEFGQAVGAAVGEVHGDASELQRAWDRVN